MVWVTEPCWQYKALVCGRATPAQGGHGMGGGEKLQAGVGLGARLPDGWSFVGGDGGGAVDAHDGRLWFLQPAARIL